MICLCPYLGPSLAAAGHIQVLPFCSEETLSQLELNMKGMNLCTRAFLALGMPTKPPAAVPKPVLLRDAHQ